MRSGRRTAVGVAVLALVLFLPAVLADHVYSHRYILLGRVLDPDGRPLSGVEVAPEFPSGTGHEGHCSPSTANTTVTDADGLFYLCNHVHDIQGALDFRVAVGGSEHVLAFNTAHRRSLLLVELAADADARAPTAGLPDYEVSGVVWSASGRLGTSLENVHVEGTTVEGVTVAITIEDAGVLVASTAVSDAYGNFRASLPAGELTDQGVVRLQVEGEDLVTVPADPRFRATDLVAQMSGEAKAKTRHVGVAALAILSLAGLAVVGTVVLRRAR